MEKLKQLDESLFLQINHSGSEFWDSFWLIITDQWMSIPIYALLSILILRKTGFKSAFISGAMILALVGLTLIISRLVKYGVARPRPCSLDYDMMRLPLGEDCGDFGFFSSHSSVGLALMVFIGYILKPFYKYIFWPLLIWVGLFGWSRIYVAKHYPGDIIVGFIVGFIFAFMFYKLRQWIFKKYHL